MLKDFKNLFRGSQLAHGVWQKANGHMSTDTSPATEEDYRKHLVGDVGLGIIPVNEEGMCYFGAIDVDIDTIDHKELYGRVTARNLPLSVCRSKSGGAHLYVFFKEPYAAGTVQNLLRKWSGLLGYPSKTEIFPKQTKSTSSNLGNWINLPYFSAANTVRYGVDSSGSLDIEGFLAAVRFYDPKSEINEKVTSDLIQINLMPPCLQEITKNGLTEGSRNNGLFSFGVFFRKSSPNGWQDKLRSYNQNYVESPLPHGEVEAAIKGIENRNYQYKCDSEPCVSYCDRKTCLTMQYGVGNKPWEDENNFDEITVGNLRKILTDPPTYVLEVNSKDIHLNSDDFRQFDRLRKRIFEIHDQIIRPIKQLQWEQKIKGLLLTKVDIEAPEDASAVGAFSNKIDDFLALSKRSKDREDLLRGMPIIETDSVLFQVDYLQRYLQSQKVIVSNSDLYSILHRRKASYAIIKIKGKTVRAWKVPLDTVNLQTENYTDVKFGEAEEGEI